jgi:hypothetical protein
LSLSIVALYFLKYIKIFLQIFWKGINAIVISDAREGWKRHPTLFSVDTANSPTWSFYGRARPKQKTSLSFSAPFSEISKKSISLAN